MFITGRWSIVLQVSPSSHYLKFPGGRFVIVPRLFPSHLRFPPTCRRVALSLRLATAVLLVGVALGAAVQAQTATKRMDLEGRKPAHWARSQECRSAGVLGTLELSRPNGIPGSRSLASTWTDSGGNFWLFGGNVVDQYGAGTLRNDLWRSSRHQPMDLDQRRQRYCDLPPGLRHNGCARCREHPWRPRKRRHLDRQDGNLWLFGGLGHQSWGYLNNPLSDLWEFNPSTSLWTWMGGSTVTFLLLCYGTSANAGPRTFPEPARAGRLDR